MEWIKISEKTPVRGKDVLVMLKRKGLNSRPDKVYIRVGRMLSNRNVWIIGDNFGFNIGKVTHWMSLPDFPAMED